MPSFINDVLENLIKQETELSQLKFILPSKRASLFLKREIAQLSSKTIFAPEVLSIEEFIEELSQLQKVSNTELLFEFYEAYKENSSSEIVEPFDSFLKWAQMLLQDFNEIDRYLIPPKNIFDYLEAIQDLNHWSLDKNQTPLIQDYLNFWKKLDIYYTSLNDRLIKTRKGYQGLLYKEAVENLQSYIQFNDDTQHIFIGFNALNTCETVVVKELLHNQIAQIYWDIDELFMNSKVHDAAYFLRSYKKDWSFFKSNSFNWTHNYYQQQKVLNITGVPKNIGQVKYVGQLLSEIKQKNTSLKNTAVVLGNESLLTPLLNSLPEDINKLNITMGYPLHSIPLASLFEQLFTIHKKEKKAYYHKDVVSIISHQSIRPLFVANDEDYSQVVLDTISTNNLAYLTLEKLKSIVPEKEGLIELIFGSWNNDPEKAISNCSSLIFRLKSKLQSSKKNNLLPLEYLFRFNEVFNQLKLLHSKYNHISSIEVLYNLFSEILRNETLDFRGEPLQGLQIMGMLESRVLDFDTVILTSVNENILPAGKSNNSFIPYDVKRENGLPTYKEKDAVYTYHFYRLIQRAKEVHIIYNTEPDVLKGGEKSRFITQLEIDGIHKIKHQLVTPKVPEIKDSLQSIKKTPDIIERLNVTAQKGFSPSSLTAYIRNPLDFYYQKILGVYEQDEVEETVAANTLGTVVHNTLEDLYRPTEGSFLSLDDITIMRQKIDERIQFHFNDIYKEGELSKGKNLIIYEIAKRYVSNFLNAEEASLTEGNQIKIIKLEEELNCFMQIEGLEFPIKLVGKVDRIDEFNGVLRIIDYKTGKVEQPKVEIVNWEDLTTDYDKYGKSFQVLMYAYIMNLKNPFNAPVEAGIISFKNMKSGFLKFSKKDRVGNGARKDSLVTPDTLKDFERELKRLLLEIYDPKANFIEKTIDG
ncbi:PD-(D/E)XK nuclease family protein [Flavobacteriaceae sp. LMIT009]